MMQGTLFFHPPSPFHGNFCKCNSIGIYTASQNSHCYTQCEETPTQKSAQKCAVTSRDILHERLQSAFTLANQLCWIAQQTGMSEWNVKHENFHTKGIKGREKERERETERQRESERESRGRGKREIITCRADHKEHWLFPKRHIRIRQPPWW